MIKLLMAAAVLIALTTQADARKRQRVTVYAHPSQPLHEQRLIRRHPIAVEYMLAYIFCGFHVFSVGPEPKPGQLGSCASYFAYPTHHRRRA